MRRDGVMGEGERRLLMRERSEEGEMEEARWKGGIWP